MHVGGLAARGAVQLQVGGISACGRYSCMVPSASIPCRAQAYHPRASSPFFLPLPPQSWLALKGLSPLPLPSSSQSWLALKGRPVVIKPQGTGCGHGIEFFFADETRAEIEAKVGGCGSITSFPISTLLNFHTSLIFVVLSRDRGRGGAIKAGTLHISARSPSIRVPPSGGRRH